MTGDVRHGYTQVADGVRIHHVSAGSGPLVLLVHGFPSCWATFARQLEELSDDHHVVAVDALGANLSSKPDDLGAYRIDRLVAQVDAVARDVGGEQPFVLVGHDWGGALAWSFARRRPDRLLGVVGISAPPYEQLVDLLRTDPEQRRRSSYMWTMRDGAQHAAITSDDGTALFTTIYEPLRALPGYTEQIHELMRDALAQPGAIDGGIDWYRANIPPIDALDELPPSGATDDPIRVPALAIWGEDDGTFVPSFVDDLPAYVRDVDVLGLPGTRHWPMFERPGEVDEALRAFLARSITRRAS